MRLLVLLLLVVLGQSVAMAVAVTVLPPAHRCRMWLLEMA
jgi:hypothetical protein